MPAASQVLRMIEAAGPAGITTTELRTSLAFSEPTMYRALRRLLAEGAIERSSRGRYRARGFEASPPARLLTDVGGRIWRLLEAGNEPGYLSGLDILGSLTHHLLLDFPHLVVCTSGFGDDLGLQLADLGLLVVTRGRFQGAPKDRVVIVREVSRWERYGVVHHMAFHELAWVDLYREVRMGTIQMDGRELGAILTPLVGRPNAMRRLRTVSAAHGAEIRSVLDGTAERGLPRDVLLGWRQ